jgi:hypothetical protein
MMVAHDHDLLSTAGPRLPAGRDGLDQIHDRFAHPLPFVFTKVPHVDRPRFVPRPPDQSLNISFVVHRGSPPHRDDCTEVGNLPGVFLDHFAPIVRNAAEGEVSCGARRVALARRRSHSALQARIGRDFLGDRPRWLYDQCILMSARKAHLDGDDWQRIDIELAGLKSRMGLYCILLQNGDRGGSPPTSARLSPGSPNLSPGATA